MGWDDTPATDRACVACGATFKAQFASICSPCGAAREATERRRNRRSELADARRSLPGPAWMRFGEAQFASAARRAGPILDACRAWTPDAGWLLLLGPTGVGKTACAVALAHQLLDAALEHDFEERGQPSPDRDAFQRARCLRFASAPSLVAAHRAHPLGRGESAAVDDALDASVLVLDECTAEPLADGLIFRIVDARYQRGALTIATSGHPDFESVAGRYGEAMPRRFLTLGRVVTWQPGAR